MDELVEEIILEPLVRKNEDLNKKFIDHKSNNIQKQKDNYNLFIRIFHSNKYLKEFLLWIILLICLLILAGPLTIYISSLLPEIKKRNIENHLFSEERARDYLKNLSQYGSRVSNTRGNFDARDFLISKLNYICSINKRNLQCEFDLQNFNDSNYNQLQNILVRVSNSSEKSINIPSLMLSAHYDTVEFSEGGSDDGSGVVILLELFSNMINDIRINFSHVNLIILLTGAEEIASQGAQAFIRNHIWKSNIYRFINIDAANCNEKANLVRMKSSELILDYSRVLGPHANVILEDISKRIGLINDYDTFSFEGSLIGYEFGFLVDSYTYHTILDHSSLIKQGVIQHLGDNLNILIRNILMKNIYFEEKDDNNDFIYFDIFSRYLFVYKMSTSILIQQILIILILLIGIILIIFDHLWHRQRSLLCNDRHCIYNNFESPFILRLISIILYIISNCMSVFVGICVSMLIGWIMSKISPVSWFGNSTLAIFLFSIPCLIGFIIIGYIWNIFHEIIQKKFFFKNSILINNINFDFEQNYSILFVYCILMIISIYSNNRSLYIILVWSIFICPIYLILMIIQFIIHWKKSYINFFDKKYHWLYLPLIICLIPLSHTNEIINRLIRIVIPLLGRRFLFGWSFRSNLIICSLIIIPTTFFLLILIPILERIKQFGRILIILCSCFLFIFIFAYYRQPFNKNHPNVFYAKHITRSVFKMEQFSNISFIVPIISESSIITVQAYDDIKLSLILDSFSSKTGYILYNKRCSRKTLCTFDDTFNRTNSIQYIKIDSIKNFFNYRIIIRHVLSYNIKISSFPLIKYIIRNRFNIPRTETIIDIKLNSTLISFNINIKIRRCDLIDSPFLVLFTRLMPNIVLMGKGQCQAIEDDATIIIDPIDLFN